MSLWCWWDTKKQGVLKVHSFLALWGLGLCGLTPAAHKRPGFGRVHIRSLSHWVLTSLITLCQCSNIPGGEPGHSFLSSLHVDTGYVKAFCLSFFISTSVPSRASFTLARTLMSISTHCRSFQPKGPASISYTSHYRLGSDYKLTADEDRQEHFWPDFEFCLPLRKKSTKIWYINQVYLYVLFSFPN